MAKEKLIPDMSVISEGDVSKKLGAMNVGEVVIHEAILSELEYHANENKALGYLGLDELKKIRDICAQKRIEMRFSGKRMQGKDLKYHSKSELDAIVRDLAYEEDGILMTADKIQAKAAAAKGIEVIFVDIISELKQLKLETYFDKTTMSVHLRENITPFAKKGVPGNWGFVEVGDHPLTRDEVKEINREIIEETNVRDDAFIEIERAGSSIVQLGPYRIVITRPPFSDGWEITAVRPVKKLDLDAYQLSTKLMERITLKAEGVLIAGAPGMGKSTFATALAEFYASKNKVVKTVEAPRDLILPDTITQYAISHGDAEEVHDILLLSRPDYTFFDEMRNTDDFKLFADLRLAGIGFIGVVHATKPIDAIQRFVGRIELGVIPQIIDTVIFIKDGGINKVLNLQMSVKVPTGMTEADLARPVVVVEDFETAKPEYELYTYGEETVVIPLANQEQQKSPMHQLAEKQIEDEIRSYCSDARVEMIGDHKCRVYVPPNKVAALIGRQGKTVQEIERKLGMHIDVESMGSEEQQSSAKKGESIPYTFEIGKKSIHIYVDEEDQDIKIYIKGNFHMSAKASKKGIMKIKKTSSPGRVLLEALQNKEQVELRK